MAAQAPMVESKASPQFKVVANKKALTSAQRRLIRRRNRKDFVAFVTVQSAESSVGFDKITIVS